MANGKILGFDWSKCKVHFQLTVIPILPVDPARNHVFRVGLRAISVAVLADGGSAYALDWYEGFAKTALNFGPARN